MVGIGLVVDDATALRRAPPPEGRVVIVGAGIAGLVAAQEIRRRFANGKCPEIIIVEAANACGGRVRATTFHNLPINEGAHWFHKGEKNDFYKYVTAIPRVAFSTPNIDNFDSVVVIAPQGNRLGRPTSGRQYVFWQTAIAGAGLLVRLGLYALVRWRDVAVGTLARWSWTDGLKRFSDYNAQFWGGVDSADDASTWEAVTTWPSPGGVQLQEANGVVITHLEKQPQGAVRIVKPATVTAVTDNPNGHAVVTVTTTAGTVQAECSACIVTVSVGVLEDTNAIKFDDDTRRVLDGNLERLTMGHMCKIVVRVPETALATVPPNTFVLNYTKNSEGFLHMHTAGKPLVTLFLGGFKTVDQVEQSVPEALNVVAKQFAAVTELKNLKITAADIHVTGWSKNRLFRGAYSALKPRGKRINPFQNYKVIFAGEAFSTKSPSMMIGAYHSGLKAADLV